MTADAPAPEQFYHAIEEHQFAGDRLPTPDELREAEATLSAVWEFLVQPIMEGVNSVADKGEPNSITFEDIGRLLVWAQSIRDRAEEIADEAAKVTIIAHRCFDVASGCLGDGTDFDGIGRPRDYAEFDRQKRRYGFGTAA